MKFRNIFLSIALLAVSAEFAMTASAQQKLTAASVDKYMVAPQQSSTDLQGLSWFDPMQQNANLIYGQGWPEELAGTYNRLPARCKGVVRDQVWYLSRQCAGLSLIFETDSPLIKVRYTVTDGLSMSHMAATGVSGVDMYSVDSKGKMRWCGADNLRSFKDTITYTYNRLSYFDADAPVVDPKGMSASKSASASGTGYRYRLYLPPYNHVSWMEIGVEQGARFEFVAPDPEDKPILIYGTSIAQGACASRPGMIWTTIVQRETGLPVMNLAFSGNAWMEPELFDLMSEVDARMYIIDAMPNMDSANEKYIYDRTVVGVHKIRAVTSAPILLVAHCGYSNAPTSEARTAAYSGCNVQLEKAYKALVAEGVENVYFLPHDEIVMGMDDMVEGWHPNDLGMSHIAANVEKAIAKILK